MGKIKFEAELEVGETLVISATLEEGVFMHYPKEEDYFDDDEEEPEPTSRADNLLNVVPLSEFPKIRD